jgi:hypothetical protein
MIEPLAGHTSEEILRLFEGFGVDVPTRLAPGFLSAKVPCGASTTAPNKLFLFVGAEWMRLNVALDPVPTTVPTEATRRGDFGLDSLCPGPRKKGEDAQVNEPLTCGVYYHRPLV